MTAGVFVKRSLIVVHRWLGVALCLLFLIWFPSGIGMMYWSYPTVSARDRLDRAPALDAATIKLSPWDAFKTLGTDDPPAQVRLNTFDGRPVYRFGGRGFQQIVYADTGDEQIEVPAEMVRRAAASWTKQPAAAATVEELNDVDQWTLQGRIRDLAPLHKFSWPNGEQVYVSANTGEVEQYTTTASRWGAYVSAIPHWLYFTPLRKHGPEWSSLVIWTSAIGTGASMLGIVIGVWMYSPSKRYRNAGAPTAIPYRGQKRLHTIFGLVFGLGAVTWHSADCCRWIRFRGEPIARSGEASRSDVSRRMHRAISRRPCGAGTSRRLRPQASEGGARAARCVGGQGAGAHVGGRDVGVSRHALERRYAARAGATAIRSMGSRPRRITEVVTRAAGPNGLAEIRTLNQYDRYYLDRLRERPLPVVLARLNDEEGTRFYIDPKTARVVGSYSARNWMSRWAYHGLHSFDFPWLYNYRPLWDIVVITFMVGGTALCVTSLVLAWRVLGRKLRAIGQPSRAPDLLNEDLVVS
jgi:hypothetical protein